MENTVLVKLGGSVITDKSEPYKERRNIIRRLCSEIKDVRDEIQDIELVVGHGGGSYPHQSAKKYRTHKGIVDEDSYEGIARVQHDAARLNRIVVEEMIEAGLPAISVQPSAGCVAEGGEIHSWDLKSLKKALDLSLVPVPYGDVALDYKKGCCILSTEKLLQYLARKLKAKKLVLCSDVDGVYTSDPSKNDDAELIEEINPENYREIRNCLTGSNEEDVTGGMLHKVERCLDLAEKGIDCHIIGGENKGALRNSLLDREVNGTLITC